MPDQSYPDPDHERRNRALTDQDIEALADKLEKTLTSRFYTNLGRGLWGFAWRGIILGALAIAAYGAMQEGHHL